MHCLGNDFVILDLITQKFYINHDLILKIANRKLGIGCDQILILYPPKEPDAHFSYRIFNTDGSEAEQCGNGACCLGKFFIDKGFANTTKTTIIADCPGGQVSLKPSFKQNGFITLGLRNVPMPEKINLSWDSKPFDIYKANMGNPHAILMNTRLEQKKFHEFAQYLQSHAEFPEGANVHQALVKSHQALALESFERGAGPTLACGSGALAAGLVASTYEFSKPEDDLEIVFQLGSAFVSFKPEKGLCYLSAEPRTSFTGQIKL